MKFKRPHTIFEYFIYMYQKENYNKKETASQLKYSEIIDKYLTIYDFDILKQSFWNWFCDNIAPIYIEIKNLNHILTAQINYKSQFSFIKFDIAAVYLIIQIHNQLFPQHINNLKLKCKNQFNQNDINKLSIFSEKMQKDFKKYIFKDFDMLLFR